MKLPTFVRKLSKEERKALEASLHSLPMYSSSAVARYPCEHSWQAHRRDSHEPRLQDSQHCADEGKGDGHLFGLKSGFESFFVQQ